MVSLRTESYSTGKLAFVDLFHCEGSLLIRSHGSLALLRLFRN